MIIDFIISSITFNNFFKKYIFFTFFIKKILNITISPYTQAYHLLLLISNSINVNLIQGQHTCLSPVIADGEHAL